MNHTQGLKSFAEIAGMTQPENYWKCEIGNERYLLKNEVPCDATFTTGDGGGRHYDHICVRHYVALLDKIDELWPYNRYLLNENRNKKSLDE